MFVQHKQSGHLVEVLNLENLYDPCQKEIVGRFHCGEEMQDPESFIKLDVIFPSGEALPRCWLDPNFRTQVA
jgi:hypothetical protein